MDLDLGKPILHLLIMYKVINANQINIYVDKIHEFITFIIFFSSQQYKKIVKLIVRIKSITKFETRDFNISVYFFEEDCSKIIYSIQKYILRIF